MELFAGSHLKVFERNTPALCRQHCETNQQPFAGMFLGQICHCFSESDVSQARLTPDGCSSPCPGDGGLVCGGAGRWSIYAAAGHTNVPIIYVSDANTSTTTTTSNAFSSATTIMGSTTVPMTETTITTTATTEGSLMK